MNESDFLARADATLATIERAIEAVGLDIEVDRSGSVLTLELADAGKIVINTQAPMQQIWVAARSGGFHFGWSDGAWRDTRDGRELFTVLSAIVSSQGGVPVVLAAR
ncbi:MAG TPA: iron donor protein CyaY [Burkholderiaceae bacterium]|nr:iron donor protein CyaY [Burkholderiaceae bacterium]